MSEIIDTLRENRSMRIRERTALLLAEASPGLVSLVNKRRLNWLETPIMLVLAMYDEDDFPGGATVADLSTTLKQRSGDVALQLVWLNSKDLVVTDGEGGKPDAQSSRWDLSEAAEAEIDAPPSPPAPMFPPGIDPASVEFLSTRPRR